MSRHRLAIAVVCLGVLLGSPLAYLAAAPAAPDHARPDDDDRFHAAGDGTLPRDRPTLRAAGAPLSSDERGYAIRLALRALPDSARDVLDAPGAEVLAAEPAAAPGSGAGRLVQVSLYDYDTDRAHQVVVDLTADEVTRRDAVRRLQLPPSAAETQVALDLALAADPALRFARQFHTVTGAPLQAAEQVHVVAGAWLPGGATGDAGHTDATPCGPHRCLQLLVALPSGQYLDTTDVVVDLSAGAIVDLADGGQHAH